MSELIMKLYLYIASPTIVNNQLCSHRDREIALNNNYSKV
jgi:hypothetical protein